MSFIKEEAKQMFHTLFQNICSEEQRNVMKKLIGEGKMYKKMCRISSNLPRNTLIVPKRNGITFCGLIENKISVSMSKHVLFGSSGLPQYVRQPPGTEFKPQYTVKTVKHCYSHWLHSRGHSGLHSVDEYTCLRHYFLSKFNIMADLTAILFFCNTGNISMHGLVCSCPFSLIPISGKCHFLKEIRKTKTISFNDIMDLINVCVCV